MHTTILDLQKLLTNHPEPHIIAPTETKHRHIKSIWRQTLSNYKLVYNPSLYNKHTKRCFGGTILAVHKSAYTTIKPIQVPPPYHPYLAIALLTPKVGSEIRVISNYLPQHQSTPDTHTYRETLNKLRTLLTTEQPNTPVLLGGDLQAMPSPHHDSYYKPLADLITDTRLTHPGDPLTPTTYLYRTPTTSDLSRALNANDHHIKTLVQTLPDDGSNYNEKGSLVTKRQLLQSAWGELKE